MDIVIIGSGNVAIHLAEALNSQHNIVSVYSRKQENAAQLAGKFKANATDNIQDIPSYADFYIISVKDDAISEITALMPRVEGIVAHTAGSVPMDVLSRFRSYGVLYPFQTFSKNKTINFRDVPVLIEGNTEETTKNLTDLAESLTEKVFNINSDQRLLLHLAAVFSCNFVNHFYHIADSIFQKADLPFDLLLPLIDETAQKVRVKRPFDAQTGPAVRNDTQTIEKHIDILLKLNEKKTASLYREISDNIIETHKRDK